MHATSPKMVRRSRSCIPRPASFHFTNLHAQSTMNVNRQCRNRKTHRLCSFPLRNWRIAHMKPPSSLASTSSFVIRKGNFHGERDVHMHAPRQIRREVAFRRPPGRQTAQGTQGARGTPRAGGKAEGPGKTKGRGQSKGNAHPNRRGHLQETPDHNSSLTPTLQRRDAT